MSGVTQGDVLRLAEPTPASAIKQRQGPGGRTLDYVDARFVMDRLDELGPGNWQDRYEDRANGSVRCGIGVNVEGEWVWKWDVGDVSDIEPEKGAHSEAFKRAGVKWGIGRDLYGDHAAPARNAPQRPQAAPQRTAPAPVAPRPAPTAGVPPEPPWMDGDPVHAEMAEMAGLPAHLAAVNDSATLPDPRDGFYGPTCPVHKGRAWKDTSRGPKCTANDGTRDNPDWCTWKPSRKWIAEHETAGVA